MTRYAVDDRNRTLISMWPTALGDRAATVAQFPATAEPEEQLAAAERLTWLSQVLWFHYTSQSDAETAPTAGPRCRLSRARFKRAAAAVERPDLPDETGQVHSHYDPLLEIAHAAGRAVADIGDEQFKQAVIADLTEEIESVVQATSGDLSGRAAQAALLSTPDALQAHITAANDLLTQDALVDLTRILTVEPTAAAVAAAHWLKTAADVVARMARIPTRKVLAEADNIQPGEYAAANELLQRLETGESVHDVAVDMISEARLLAHGTIATIKMAQFVKYALDSPSPFIDITVLEVARPAPSLLESLTAGIRGCRLLYAEHCADNDEDSEPEVKHEEARIDEEFRVKVRAQALRKPLRPKD
ncbi:hypothetical protein [Paractinoplanes atraurantiacus]|uniref:Uncharacterized protein n=1 Tax=Paractinoplanes atraurantiacus TaxID=1036182 RepID=A0A285GQB4_9ACTN|nr:hypothetical protein [Actinoplanes atraurantiacus]SNY25749.1 hypothetical protein SAMN05421748_102402 [Actinoplanes atraurantiacus]